MFEDLVPLFVGSFIITRRIGCCLTTEAVEGSTRKLPVRGQVSWGLISQQTPHTGPFTSLGGRYGIIRPAKGFIRIYRVCLRCRKPAHETIVMLKRLSEAISQSNIESNPLASETHCSQHSSCNFSHPQDVIDERSEVIAPRARALRCRAKGGK